MGSGTRATVRGVQAHQAYATAAPATPVSTAHIGNLGTGVIPSLILDGIR
jgi:hypothetical protein